MSRFSLKDILEGTGGVLISSAIGQRSFSGVSIDTRTLTSGQVFLALRGKKHDGHDFIRQAYEAGAALAVIDRNMPAEAGRLAPMPMVVVDDTLAALQSLASHWRWRHPVPLLAVVGSVGKTTTKEMVAAVLSVKGPCLKNAGNFNNQIGLPLSLLELDDSHRFAVLEMGSSAMGEIALLASLARPQGAVVTRLGWAHLEGFGSHENLVREKGSVLENLDPAGWCALNADDPSFPALRDKAPGRVISYGIGSGDVRATGITIEGGITSFFMESPLGRQRITLQAFGSHFVENALAAAAVTLPLDVPVEGLLGALMAWRPPEQRGGILRPLPGVIFIDDTYNANPLSVEMAMKNLALARREGVAVAVLGEMLELGEAHEEGHMLVGRRAAELGMDYLIAVGAPAVTIRRGAIEGGMDPQRVITCAGWEEGADALRPLLVPGVWVLFKGSRGSRMERVMGPFLPGGPSTEAGS